MRLQVPDLGPEKLGGHRQLADLLLQAPDLVIPRVGGAAPQRRLAGGEERVAPAAQLRGRHPPPAGHQLEAPPPQQAAPRPPLPPRRHPPPERGRGPVSASVWGALRRAHAHPVLLVHPPPPRSPLTASRCLSEL